MPSDKKVFLEEVCAQVRWKTAHGCITKELGNHLEDRESSLRAEGLESAQAEARAVADMGNAERIGLELDALHRPQIGWKLLLPFFLLVVLGRILASQVLVVWPMWTEYAQGNVASVLLRWLSQQGGILLVGAGAFLLGYLPSLEKTLRWGWAAAILGIAAVMLVQNAPQPVFIDFTPLRGSLRIKTHYFLLAWPVLYALCLCPLRGKGAGGLGLALLGPAVSCILFSQTPRNLVDVYGVGIGEPEFLFPALLLSCAVLGLFIWQGGFRVPNKWAFVSLAITAALLCLYAWYHSHWRQFVLPELGWGARLKIIAPTVRDLWAGVRPIGKGALPADLQRNFDFAPEAALQAALSSVAQLEPPLIDRFEVGWRANYQIVWLAHHIGWLPALLPVGALLGLLAWCWRRCIKQPGQAVRLTGVACLLVLSTQTALYLLANFGLPVHAGFPLPLLAQGNAAFYLYLWMFGLLFCILRAGHVYVGSPLPRRAVAATQASLQS